MLERHQYPYACKYWCADRAEFAHVDGMVFNWMHGVVHTSSVCGADTGMRADGDLLIVRELRKMSTLSKQGAKIAAPVSDEQLKWLNWPDFVQVCQAI